MQQLEGHTGAWTGTNAFRMMPGDAPHEAGIQATISLAAGGRLAQIAYTWQHADDGVQEGLLVLGEGDGPGAVAAFWGDSWHQHPEPRSLDGGSDGPVLTVGYAYGGAWRWEIVVDASEPDHVSLRMDNVVPASAATTELPAGPYAAMQAVLRRA